MALAPAALTRQSDLWSSVCTWCLDLSRPWAEEGLSPAFCSVWCLSRHLSSFVCNDGTLLYQILSLAMKSLNLRIQDVQTLQQKHFALNMGKLKRRGYLSQNPWPVNNQAGARTQEGVGSPHPQSIGNS